MSSLKKQIKKSNARPCRCFPKPNPNDFPLLSAPPISGPFGGATAAWPFARTSFYFSTTEPKSVFTAELPRTLTALRLELGGIHFASALLSAAAAAAAARCSRCAAKRAADTLVVSTLVWNRHQVGCLLSKFVICCGFGCVALKFSRYATAKNLASSGSMSLNESRTPGRAPLPIPLRPHHQGGALMFEGESQPVSEPQASAAIPIISAIGDFIDEQCDSVKRSAPNHPPSSRVGHQQQPNSCSSCTRRFFGLAFGTGCCGRQPKNELPKFDQPPPIFEVVPEKTLSLHAALKKVPLLAGLSDSDIHKLESVCELHSYAPGQLIFESGDLGDFAVIVLSGELVIHLIPTDGHASSFGGEKFTSQRLLQPGEHLGAQTLLVSKPRGFSLVSSQMSRAALLHRSSLMGAIGPLDNHIMKDRDLYSKFAPLLHHRHI